VSCGDRRRRLQVLAFLSPWLIGFLAFDAYPMLASLGWSFTRYDFITPPRWAGLENYRFLAAHDPLVRQAIRNTLWMLGVGLPLQLFVALGLALLLVHPSRTGSLYRAAIYMPSIVPPVAATLAFAWLLDPTRGPVNGLLGAADLPEPLWFYDPLYAKPGLALLGLWGVGPTVILYLAGLVRIPRHLHEAALVEGAGPWQRFRRVTLPMLSPVLVFTVIVGIVGSLQYFTQAYIASDLVSAGRGQGLNGGPQGSTRFYSTWLYREAFTGFHMGYASALAWMLTAVGLVATVIVLRGARRWTA